MTDITVYEPLGDMTTTEAIAEDIVIRNRNGETALRLFVFHERRGYKALGYLTFEEYAEKRLDLPRTTAYNWLSRVRATMTLYGIHVDKLVDSLSLEGTVSFRELLPQRTAAEMNRLPASLFSQVWEEYTNVHDGATGTEGANINELKKIINRHLRYDAPQVQAVVIIKAPAKAAETAQVEPKPVEAASVVLPEPVLDTKAPAPSVGDACSVEYVDAHKILMARCVLATGQEVSIAIPYSLLRGEGRE
jgi:hypothetical protein